MDNYRGNSNCNQILVNLKLSTQHTAFCDDTKNGWLGNYPNILHVFYLIMG